MPGGRLVQVAMCLATALLGVVLLLWAGSSELGLFGWAFVALGGLGVLFWFLMPSTTRR